MAVKIRLARAGAKKAPFYRIVAADSRAPRDGRFIEVLGRYNPRTEPSSIELDVEKTEAWIAKGAQLTDTVARLLEIARSPEGTAPQGKTKVSKKASAKASAEATAEAAAPEAATETEAPAEDEMEPEGEPATEVEAEPETESATEE